MATETTRANEVAARLSDEQLGAARELTVAVIVEEVECLGDPSPYTLEGLLVIRDLGHLVLRLGDGRRPHAHDGELDDDALKALRRFGEDVLERRDPALAHDDADEETLAMARKADFVLGALREGAAS